MKTIKNYHELYNIILKSFYCGEYCKGDRFPTQLELARTYSVATNSVKKVFRLLLEDGFITTNRSFGTFVTFDSDNPEHVAKVLVVSPSPDNELDTLFVPSRFIASAVCNGIKTASYELRAQYVKSIDSMLASPLGYEQLILLRCKLFRSICSSFNNRYISDFADLLYYDYICINTRVIAAQATQATLRKLVVSFYTKLRRLIVEERVEDIYLICLRHLEELYSIPNLFVYSVIEHDDALFAQQTLYAQLMHHISLFIVANNLKKGEMLPSEHCLASQCGVSIVTVRKAMSVLKEIGLVDGERFVGTRMRDDWNAPAMQAWLSSFMEEQKKMITDSLFIVCTVTQTVCRYIERVFDDQIAGEMRRTLERDWQGYESYRAPMFMAEIFASPIVNRTGSVLLSKFFYHAHGDLTKFLAIRMLQMSSGFEDAEQVHQYAIEAIEALEHKNYELFASKVDSAVLLNLHLLQSTLDITIYKCLDTDSDRQLS